MCVWDMTMMMRRTHKLEPQCDQSCMQGIVLCFVSSLHLLSMFPHIHFSPACEFLADFEDSHIARTGLLRCWLHRWHKIGWKETKILIRCGKYSIKKLTKTMWNKQRCGQLQSHVWITNFHGRNEKIHTPRTFESLRGRTVWLVSWQTRLNNSTKYPLHASMTITSKKKKWNLLENCQIHALKLFWNVCIWQELDDLIFYGQ